VAADVSEQLPIPFFEVVSHASIAATAVTKNKKIGVIGTNATVKSGKHKEYILKNMPDADVVAQGCSLFVPLVEEGWCSAEDLVVTKTVERYLEPIKEFGADTLILGCTHYPVLSDAIRKILGDGVTLINAGTATAKAVSSFLQENDLLNSDAKKGNIKFFVSDKADSFRQQASILLGADFDDSNIEQVSLSSI